MTDPATNAEQRKFWSEDVGDVWARQAQAMDATLAGVLDGLLARARLSTGARVYDIGCGAGASTRAIAAAVGETGHVTGLDISEPLLAQARAQNGGAEYLIADAQSYAFDAQSADAVLSRFGVMFFSDTAAAFANMARALRPAGRMVFATWGAIPENPFFTLPARVAREVLGPVPKSDPDAPGPFALRDADAVCAMLRGAGLAASVDTVNVPLPLGQDTGRIADTLQEIGPIPGAFRHHNASAADRAATLAALREALEEHRTPQGIVLGSQIHYFTATKSA
ncbi:class I SAM-dependent methyltransferase [Sulfitobacter sp. HNIBRBA3233]|uniref:class I SAM-dependent methyltransferase n=1 Tax=Sulfitobacter marinivivus TaxID=3158558 RepID=UPI0032DE45F4